jgi:hypothetical protein
MDIGLARESIPRTIMIIMTLSKASENRAFDRRWIVAGGVVLAIIVGLYAAIFLLADRIRTPAATSLAMVDQATIERGELLVIRRPDGGPDISAGKTDAMAISREDAVALVNVLTPGAAVNTARGIWMGKLILFFRDGRKLEVLLYSVSESKSSPVRFQIEQYQYELPSSESFLAAVDAVDARIKGRSGQ